MMFQLFNVFNARSDETSAFKGLFTNHWLWAGVTLSIALHLAVIYTPFLQQAFSTTSLSASRLAALRYRREFGAVVARVEQSCHPRAGKTPRLKSPTGTVLDQALRAAFNLN